MKKILLILSAVAALSACIKENSSEQEQGGKFAFTAGFSDPSDPATKVFLEHNYYYKELYVLWEKGDQVTVNDGANNVVFESDRTGFSTSLYASAAGDFDQDAPVYYSLFPHDPEAVFSQDDDLHYVTTTLPATQYARRDAFSSHIAVSSTTQAEKAFMYKNVTAVFKATITTEGVESLVFAGKNYENVAGKIRVNIETAEYSLIDSPSSTVTVLPPEGRDTFEPGRYYFTILPQTFAAGFTVTINFGDGQPAEVRNVEKSNVEIRRSSLSIGKAIGTDGKGTQSKPYLIRNKYDFEGIATIVADDTISYEATTYIRIEEDINLSTIKSWTPINNSRDPQYIAKLDIDGNGKTISGFAPTDFTDGIGTVNDGMDHNQPSLFGIMYGDVRNLTITDATLNTTTSTVGILAGQVGFENKSATVTNVHVSGTLIGKKCIGGISGMARNATFRNCSADVNITATDEQSGGLVGRYYESVTVENCSTKGVVNGKRAVGGLLGGNEKTSPTAITVTDCLSECTITGNYQVGGLIGQTQSPISITGSWAKGNITATSRKRSSDFLPGKHVGGILGAAADGKAVTITKCRYTGSISADGDYVGGIAGITTGVTSITHCHAECDSIVVTGDYVKSHPKVSYHTVAVGGVLGGTKCESDVEVAYCFAEGQKISGKACGKLTKDYTLWSDWVTAVKKDSGPAVGGAIGGIIGFTASEQTNVHHNISWFAKIECERTSVYDPPCAPIVGSISKGVANDMSANRYYCLSDGTPMQIDDEFTNYEPREDLLGRVKGSVEHVLNETATTVNHYALFCQKVANTGHPSGDNSPSQTAVNKNWQWTTLCSEWNATQYKPYLDINPGPQATPAQ